MLGLGGAIEFGHIFMDDKSILTSTDSFGEGP